MEIVRLQEGQLSEAASLWNHAMAIQGQGYQDYIISYERLAHIMADKSFLPSGALAAIDGGEITGFALGYVQKVDFRKEGNLESKPGRLAGLAVRSDCWRQGTGRALLEAVEDVLRKEGKSAIEFRTYGMPISLLHGVYVDTVPYRSLLSCGYLPLEHELRLRNELSTFRLSEGIHGRRKKLASEGIIYRWYEPADRANLMEFMTQHFSGGWGTSVERGINLDPPAKILLAVSSSEIAAFMGPFYWGKPGQRGGFSSPGVHPDFRRRGIGTVLFHLGLDFLKSVGASYVEYGTGVTNPARFIYFGSGAKLLNVYCCRFHKHL
jgi:GNAT superfamily N-acetyltransferase